MEKVLDSEKNRQATLQEDDPKFYRKVIISEEAKQATTKCNKNFSCLSAEREDLCEVYSCFECVHFVICPDEENCPYRHQIKGRVFCDCPVRTELYDKYKI